MLIPRSTSGSTRPAGLLYSGSLSWCLELGPPPCRKPPSPDLVSGWAPMTWRRATCYGHHHEKPGKALRADAGRVRRLIGGGGRRDLRLPGPQRGGKDHHDPASARLLAAEH